MKCMMIITALLTVASNGELFADHIDSVHRNYEARRLDLKHDFDAMRDTARYEFNHTHKALLAKRRRAFRIDCPHTRSARVNVINEKLRWVSKAYSRKVRRISGWYHDALGEARREFEADLHYARRSPVVVERPITVVHSGGECAAVGPVPPHPGGGLHHLGRDDPARQPYDYDPHFAPVDRVARRSPRAVDWAGLLVGMLLND